MTTVSSVLFSRAVKRPTTPLTVPPIVNVGETLAEDVDAEDSEELTLSPPLPTTRRDEA